MCLVVGPLQFLIHINNLHEAIMVCSVHHFVDNINLLIDKSLKKINKHINHELKYPNRLEQQVITKWWQNKNNYL